MRVGKCQWSVIPVLLVILLTLISCNTSGIDKKKFKDLYRATVAIKASTEVGVNVMDFGALIRNLNTELIMIEDNVDSGSNNQEKELASQFRKVFVLYNQSFSAWKTQIESRDKSPESVVQVYWSRGG